MIASLRIEPYLDSHRAGVIALILPIQQEFSIPITLEEQPDLLDIPAFYQRGDGNFWVATVAGEVVGTVSLLDIGGRRAALRKMFVAAAWRGSQHGVASQLLAALLAFCGERGVREVYLGTTDKFHAAHRFYEKNAFTEIDKSELPDSFPVMAVDSKFYRRSVAV